MAYSQADIKHERIKMNLTSSIASKLL